VTLQKITAIKESALDQSLRKTLIKNAHIIGSVQKELGRGRGAEDGAG
jgi:hypothetical protein